MKNNKLVRSAIDICEKPAFGYYAAVETDGELKTVVILGSRIFGSSEAISDAMVSHWAKCNDCILWQVDSLKEMVPYVGRDLADDIIIDYTKKVGDHR